MVQDSRSASYPGAAIASSYDFGSIDFFQVGRDPCTPAPATTLTSALVYGGWIGPPSHLLSVQRDCSGRRFPLLGIIPDRMQDRDAHKLGPTCWWPEDYRIRPAASSYGIRYGTSHMPCSLIYRLTLKDL
jgi:hypothetical protein